MYLQLKEYILVCFLKTTKKKLLLATARVCRNYTKSRRRLVLPTAKGRRQPSEKALSVYITDKTIANTHFRQHNSVVST